jgi:hypothetical protein
MARFSRSPFAKAPYCLLVAVVVVATGASFLPAQELTGTLYGKVVDDAGLRVPGATVTVSSPQLIKGSEARVTSQDGVYRVPALPPGVYTVKVELDLEQTRPDFPARNPTVDELQGFLKITSQLTPRTTLQGSYTHRDYEEFPSNASFTRNAAPETWSFAARYQKIIYLSLTRVLSDSTYLDAKLAQMLQKTASNFPNADRTGYQDVATGLFSGGWTGPRSDYPHREKRNIKAGLSHFREQGWGGSHNLKAGFETEFAPLWRQFDLIDDTFHLLRNGQPYRVRLYNTPLLQGRHVSRQAAYVQDEWTLKSASP